jgi:hypothetical protein
VLSKLIVTGYLKLYKEYNAYIFLAVFKFLSIEEYNMYIFLGTAALIFPRAPNSVIRLLTFNHF